MRIVKTDRGYIDMDHVLMVGEPYDYVQGMWGFDVTLMLLDKAKQMLYYPEQLGVRPKRPSDDWVDQEEWRSLVAEALTKKRDEFVKLWKGEEVPMIQTWMGRPLDQLLPDERVKAFDFATAEHTAGRMETSKMREIHRALRDAQKTSICPQAPDGKHDFSSQGCPAGMQACLHCEEVEL